MKRSKSYTYIKLETFIFIYLL